MDWWEAMQTVIIRTKHERYRELCADDSPDRDGCRRLMLELAGMPPPAPDPEPTPEDLALRAYLMERGCGCGGG